MHLSVFGGKRRYPSVRQSEAAVNPNPLMSCLIGLNEFAVQIIENLFSCGFGKLSSDKEV